MKEEIYEKLMYPIWLIGFILMITIYCIGLLVFTILYKILKNIHNIKQTRIILFHKEFWYMIKRIFIIGLKKK